MAKTIEVDIPHDPAERERRATSYAEPLRPLIRNNALVAVQASMIAIVKDDQDAARRCIEIALNSIAIWSEAGAVPTAPYPFCRDPKGCAGKGYCPRDPACND